MMSALVFLGLGLLAAIEAVNLALKVYCAYQRRRAAKARDDLEAVARVTGLVVFNAPTLADITEDDLVDGLAERETCPDYPHEIVWSES